MKAVILAGGLGSRLSEETATRPKPMVEIGGHPILWHIMKIYSAHGIREFIICLGYKGDLIKEYFANCFLYSADLTVDLENNQVQFHRNNCEPWRVTLVDTGANTMTGGRLKRVLPYVEGEPEFCFTYGDGVADVNIILVRHPGFWYRRVEGMTFFQKFEPVVAGCRRMADRMARECQAGLMNFPAKRSCQAR